MDAKTLCLGALILGDASGYDIRRLYEDGSFACFHAISYGSIYPALKALHAEGLIATAASSHTDRPHKKVYTITDAGRRALAERLKTPPAADSYRSDSLYILSFAHLLPRDMRRALLDAYRAEQLAMLEAIDDCGQTEDEHAFGRQFVRGLGRTVYAAVVKYIDENRHMIEAPDMTDAVITQEQDA